MKAPDKIYLGIQDLGSGYVYALSFDNNGEQEYIRKDTLLEWAKDMHEAYRKKYEESNHTCGEHWGQMVAFRRMIDKLNSL